MGKLYNHSRLEPIRKTLRHNMPLAEQLLWKRIQNKQINDYKFRRQYSVGSFVIDFYCPTARLAIEIDGDSHFESSVAIKLDLDRQEFLNKRKMTVLRFSNADIYNNMDGVLLTLVSHLPSPLLSKEGDRSDIR